MSHIVKVNVEIKNLQALKKAAEAIGLEFREGQQKYKWYGRSVGDYPLPEGITVDMLGKCDHALSIPGNSGAYEIGVVDQGNGSYGLLWDFWHGGFGLQALVGDGCSKLTEEYTACAAEAECDQLGWMHERQHDGSLLVYHPDGGTLTVSREGKIEANEFQGTACSLATAPLAEALGQRIDEQRKQEWNQQQQNIGQS